MRDEVLNPFFAAAVEATEEAVINCLVAADTVTGRDGHVATGIPLDRLTAIMRRHHRLHRIARHLPFRRRSVARATGYVPKRVGGGRRVRAVGGEVDDRGRARRR